MAESCCVTLPLSPSVCLLAYRLAGWNLFWTKQLLAAPARRRLANTIKVSRRRLRARCGPVSSFCRQETSEVAATGGDSGQRHSRGSGLCNDTISQVIIDSFPLAACRERGGSARVNLLRNNSERSAKTMQRSN